MRKELVQKVRQIADDLGIKTIWVENDNSTFFAYGEDVDRNTIIFDDENEIGYGIQLNDVTAWEGDYKVRCFDYDIIQHITLSMNHDKLIEFLNLVTGINSDEAKEKFKDAAIRDPRDRRHRDYMRPNKLK